MDGDLLNSILRLLKGYIGGIRQTICTDICKDGMFVSLELYKEIESFGLYLVASGVSSMKDIDV